MRQNRLSLMLIALLGAAACNNSDVPVGSPGNVMIRAFIDSDGSGGYSSGDVALAGDVVTLTGPGSTTQTATADATGLASFTAVSPGSYTATVAGTLPAGAVLASASTATVVVPFKGGDVSGQFRYVLNPGSINGVLYRDNNGNNTFDAATDTPAPGLGVTLYAGTDVTGTALATTTTGAAGDFHFNTLRPGTYTISIAAIPTITVIGGVTQTFVVGAAATTAAPIQFTGNLLTPISQVRTAAVGATVAFTGTAVANAGLVGTNQLYVEDANAGVLVFGAPTAGIVTGDVVRVVGVTSVFNGELEIAAPSGGTLSVTKVSSGAAPAARNVTVAQLIANTFAGQLVTVAGVRVRSVATTGSTSYNVNFQGATAADTFQVRIGNTTNVPIPSTFWQVGRSYDVTGIDGYFNGLPQLKPRAASDVVAGALTLTIAQARTHSAPDTVSFVGVVYAGTGTYTLPTAANLSIYVQDSSGGAEVFNIPTGTSYVPGDSVSVRGVVSVFNGEYEVARFDASNPPLIQKLGTGTLPTPKTITAPDFASKRYDGQLIRLSGLTVVSVSTPNSSGAYNVVTTAPDGSSVTVRIDASPVGIANTFWQVGTRYDVAGAALNFVSGATTTPEVKPRSPADVSLTPTGVITIAAAKLVSNDTVTFEGIVTAGRGTFRVDNAYVQDATSGVQIFNLPLSLTLNVGDAVRVHGKMTVFSGESEVTNVVTPTDSIKVTKLGQGGTPAPRVVTGAQFLARTFEGQLVTLPNVAILTVGTASGTGTYTVTGTAADGTTVTIFMSAPAGAVPPPSTFAVGSHYDLTGIAVPFSGAGELKPRGAGDVVPR